jgi:galactokinase
MSIEMNSDPRVDVHKLRQSFREKFGATARLFRAPGRVNIIGEHTDYNDGFVLPIAIDRETVVAGAAREDRIVRVYSVDVGEELRFNLDSPTRGRSGSWLNYVEGVARVLESEGNRLTGADLLLSSSLPIGSGLSSSAALEMSAGFALMRLSGLEPNLIALAKAGQRAEHFYVGAKVGLMDQLTSALGRSDSALLIDCRSLDIMRVPLDASRFSVVVCDTRVKHNLAASEYNNRRAECEQGVEILKRYLPGITALRDVQIDELDQYGKHLPDIIEKRCRHVVRENARTLEAASAMREGRVDRLGELLFASHASLRDDYEVSCRELDVMVESATGIEGVIGARMTGGGFGGCTVNLVYKDAVSDFCAAIADAYKKATGIEASIYVVEASDGVGETLDVLPDRESKRTETSSR